MTPADSPRVGMLNALGRIDRALDLLTRHRYRELEARLREARASLRRALENYHRERQHVLPGVDRG